MSHQEPATILEAARQQATMSVVGLWIAYLALGGTESLERVGHFLGGSAVPDAPQYDVLAQALNDSFTGLDLDHPVPYFDELGSP